MSGCQLTRVSHAHAGIHTHTHSHIHAGGQHAEPGEWGGKGRRHGWEEGRDGGRGLEGGGLPQTLLSSRSRVGRDGGSVREKEQGKVR